MSIGAFSVSLTVKDIKASKDFYEKLGFRPVMGDCQNWLILRSDDCTIGLFQGMFEKNMLTFNPGWDKDAKEINPFKDARTLQEELQSKGLKITGNANATKTGPASFMLEDPDGNPILIDQHR